MTHPRSRLPDPVRVRETPAEWTRALVHRGWADAFPWLIQGTTLRGSSDAPFDLGLFSSGAPEVTVRIHWEEVRRTLGVARVVHARQLHGSDVRMHAPHGCEGGDGQVPCLVDPCDGHATREPDVLLAVTTADCVPVFVVDPGRRSVAALHAGWRGAAAGVLERGLTVMESAFGSVVGDVHVHFGPAICGDCYEVGPEVFQALDQPVPDRPAPIDLRRVLAARATLVGVGVDRISLSAHCTRCTGSGLFSHRGGDAGRQVSYLGIRG